MRPMRPLVLAASTLLALGATGCFGLGGFGRTPMPADQVGALTTCKGSDMASIKKNLMLSGYSIRSASDDAIETDFKQVSGYGTNKELQRVSIVKVDDKTARFHVRVKSEGVEKVETGRVTTTSGKVVATDNKLVHTENEEDEHYFNESRQLHEKTHREVCGS